LKIIQTARNLFPIHLSGKPGQCSACTFRIGVKLSAKYNGIANIPAPMGKLTVKQHANGFAHAIMLAMAN
jgi:hypothetical protein